ncbi:unnamed protein product, partial [Amoebophrya sp. A25]
QVPTGEERRRLAEEQQQRTRQIEAQEAADRRRAAGLMGGRNPQQQLDELRRSLTLRLPHEEFFRRLLALARTKIKRQRELQDYFYNAKVTAHVVLWILMALFCASLTGLVLLKTSSKAAASVAQQQTEQAHHPTSTTKKPSLLAWALLGALSAASLVGVIVAIVGLSGASSKR